MQQFQHPDQFVSRHLGISENETSKMLAKIGVSSMEELICQTIPDNIRRQKELDLPAAIGEYQYLKELRETAAKNKVYRSFIGMGYYDTITPPVILRNIFENPGWYTQYTPYQAEIAQGRMEALLNYQTMICDLTAMSIANASLLDEATAAAEAMLMMFNHKNKRAKGSPANVLLVHHTTFPQTIDVLKTRASGVGIEVKVCHDLDAELTENVFAVYVQYPNGLGEVEDYSDLVEKVHAQNSLVIVGADLLSLALLKAPGEWGADAVIGSAQRFGVPMGFGGPHAAFFAVKEEFLRVMPGRIMGVSIDSHGNKAYRMTLQTREQHIRRDKASSNICTAQALLAIMAGMYGVYHGSEGIKNIANYVHTLTCALNEGFKKLNIKQLNASFFDTLVVELESKHQLEELKERAEHVQMNFRYLGDHKVGISLDECSNAQEVMFLLNLFASLSEKILPSLELTSFVGELSTTIPSDLQRTSAFMTHPIFGLHHSETAMMRYIKQLENKDLALNTAMIPLGSCTMKLNAAAELIPVSWPEFNKIHPFAPTDQTEGYAQIIEELGAYLCEITDFAGISFQPNSGAQGEYAGLLVIRAFHESMGNTHRNIILIPASAHGTNPASAALASFSIVVTKTAADGTIDVEDFRAKAVQYKDNLAGAMITYPSTHGVFEDTIQELSQIIHENGGQFYMDGANMNAQVGLTSPGIIGADVCHLNLHKTFAIPHGGGGPGMGPICVAKHLVPFLPGHSVIKTGGDNAISAVSAAPYGSTSILLISYAYIKMLGSDGVKKATEYAILNANYLKSCLEAEYQVLYKNEKNRVAHEFIIDLREFKQKYGLEVDDITKRLMDYSFHAPTVSFPVAGTLMIEPTESEPLAELDRFIEAMLTIRKEIEEVGTGIADKNDNVLKNAPHTQASLLADEWNHAYSRTKAAFPVPYLVNNKFWAAVGRVNNVHGDKNVICICPPIEEYAMQAV